MSKSIHNLTNDLAYAAAMCRVHYFRRPERLPADNISALATYWKNHYNTILGAGSSREFIDNYNRFILS